MIEDAAAHLPEISAELARDALVAAQGVPIGVYSTDDEEDACAAAQVDAAAQTLNEGLVAQGSSYRLKKATGALWCFETHYLMLNDAEADQLVQLEMLDC